MLKDTRANVFGNTIKGNDGIGLYIRDKSHGEIKNNIVLFILKQSNIFLS